MLKIARLATLLVAAGGLVAGVYLIAGSPDEDDFFTVRILVAACGVGVLALLMNLLLGKYAKIEGESREPPSR